MGQRFSKYENEKSLAFAEQVAVDGDSGAEFPNQRLYPVEAVYPVQTASLSFFQKVAELLQKYRRRVRRPAARSDQSVECIATQDSKKELEMDEKEGDSSEDAVNSRTVEDIDNLVKLILNL